MIEEKFPEIKEDIFPYIEKTHYIHCVVKTDLI
jgi:hypothetical protein